MLPAPILLIRSFLGQGQARVEHSLPLKINVTRRHHLILLFFICIWWGSPLLGAANFIRTFGNLRRFGIQLYCALLFRISFNELPYCFFRYFYSQRSPFQGFSRILVNRLAGWGEWEIKILPANSAQPYRDSIDHRRLVETMFLRAHKPAHISRNLCLN